jgi:endoglycosylceramidase
MKSAVDKAVHAIHDDAMLRSRNRTPRRTRVSIVLVVVTLAALTVHVSHAPAAPQRATDAHPVGRAFGQQRVGTARHNGRWLVDAQGRVLLPHGVNLVAKQAPYYPSAGGFSEDDAVWLKDNGFDAVRLGLTATGLMPTPGQIDDALLDRYAATVDMLAAHEIYVLVDLHQDGWGERADGEPLGSDGFPEWMTLTNGALNTHTGFPLYYATNPAIQHAFQSLWDDDLGPNGVPLQTSVATMFGALAARFADNPWVLGYDVYNEPWPGVTWTPCLAPTGCPDLEHAYLDALYGEVTRAIRAAGSDQLVFGEPFVLFNFGTAPASFDLPDGDANAGMSFHMYAASAQEPSLIQHALDWSSRTGGALLNTEWGSTTDPVVITRQADELDAALIPWMFWSYDENVVKDLELPPTGSNVNTAAALALARPHAVAVAGTPLSMSFDPASRSFEFSWATTGVNHGHFPPKVATSISTPSSIYPDGYTVYVSGAQIVSDPCAPTLLLANQPSAKSAAIRVTPGGACSPN